MRTALATWAFRTGVRTSARFCATICKSIGYQVSVAARTEVPRTGKSGCRGLSLGGAKVSTIHCNFLIYLGHATAADLEALGEEVRRRVLATSGFKLEWDIRRIGVAVGS